MRRGSLIERPSDESTTPHGSPRGRAGPIGVALIAAATFVVAACDEEPTAPGERIAELSIALDSVLLVSGGSTHLVARAVDASGLEVSSPSAIEWSSGDTAVVSVDSIGRVQARAPGRALVVASVEAVADTVAIGVTPAFASISAGSSHTCGVDGEGTAFCWGNGGQGRLGTGSTEQESAPAAVLADGVRFSSISAGLGDSCALEESGQAHCWGWFTVLGSEPPGSCVTCPNPVPVDDPARPLAMLEVGSDHACGVGHGGDAYCWGRGEFGRLGDGSEGFEQSPVAVIGGIEFDRVSAGVAHTCGMTAAGDGYCWGSNGFGRAGVDDSVSSLTSPTAIAGNLAFRAIQAGQYHSCGLRTSGSAYCWGRNSESQLGVDPSIEESAEPLAVSGGLVFSQLAVGLRHNCALSEEGDAYCWGRNAEGQLGDGGTSERSEPVAVAGGLRFVALTAGFGHTCGLLASGKAYCWGANSSGQLGDGTELDRLTPVRVTAPGD